MNYDTESVLLLDRDTRLVSTVLTLDDTPRKLNAIWELAFTNDKTLIYTGGTYLKQGQQTSGCYGVIDINHQTYSLYNSPQVLLKIKVLFIIKMKVMVLIRIRLLFIMMMVLMI